MRDQQLIGFRKWFYYGWRSNNWKKNQFQTPEHHQDQLTAFRDKLRFGILSRWFLLIALANIYYMHRALYQINVLHMTASLTLCSSLHQNHAHLHPHILLKANENTNVVFYSTSLSKTGVDVEIFHICRTFMQFVTKPPYVSHSIMVKKVMKLWGENPDRWA